jgi:hypothetical protein
MCSRNQMNCKYAVYQKLIIAYNLSLINIGVYWCFNNSIR